MQGRAKKGWYGLIFTKFEKVPRVLILHFSENGVVAVNFMPNRVSPDVFHKFSTSPPPPPPISQDVVQSHVSGQQPAPQMLITLITIIQLQNYFGEAIRRNINS